MQNDKISSELSNKKGDNQNPVNVFLGAGQDDPDKRTATQALLSRSELSINFV